MTTERNISVNAASAANAEIAVQREMAKRHLGGRIIGTFPGNGRDDDHVAIVVTGDKPHDRVTWVVKVEVS